MYAEEWQQSSLMMKMCPAKSEAKQLPQMHWTIRNYSSQHQKHRVKSHQIDHSHSTV
jgi:hypothetical protein